MRIDRKCITAIIGDMNKTTKEKNGASDTSNFIGVVGLEKDTDVTSALKASSKMSEFCKDTAFGIANFFRAEYYPLSATELKPFLKQITKEFKKIFKEETHL